MRRNNTRNPRKWVDDKEKKKFDVKYQANLAILYSFVTSKHSVKYEMLSLKY